jgi:16S rRNA (adenine1518-N6/adenine1519-N6)-dimethyltransferase
MDNRIEAKKSLGQNFLISQGIIDKIIAATTEGNPETILEVGPGKGALTEKLVATGAKIIAVEKDDRLVPFLSEKFASQPNFSLIHADILEFDPKTVGLSAGKYTLVANLPYYITGAFLQKLCESDTPPARAILMLQREVAERIVKRDGKESILALSIEAYGTAKMITRVPPGAFSPPPSIESAVIELSPISKQFFSTEKITEPAFFDTVHKGFAHKRKLLASNLKTTPETLVSCGISASARAENVPLQAWACLTRATHESL